MRYRRVRFAATTLLAIAFAAPVTVAQKKYDPGATDTEIKVGTIVPSTGKFSEYGAAGRAEAAYFRMVNDQGGVHGRKINFINLDLASDPEKAIPLAQQLVEKDEVLLTVGIWGLPANLAVRPYLNDKQVPQLFIAAADSVFDDPAHFPWTMGFQPTHRTEGLVYAKYILRIKPAAKIAMLWPLDNTSQDWVEGIRAGLGDKASSMIVKDASFSYSEASSFDSQIAALKDSGADVFLNLVVGSFASRAIRQAYDIGWHPLQFIPNASLSIAAFLEPAGLGKAANIITNARSKGWTRPESKLDPDVNAFLDWMKKYNPDASLRDANNVYGYEVAQTLIEVLKKCGDNLTRANVMKQAASLDRNWACFGPASRSPPAPPITSRSRICFSSNSTDTIGSRSAQ